jgi:hypothetical protein
MKTHHWVGAVILAVVAFVAGMWYARGKVSLP